jgi:hypothetical protein
MKNYPAITFLGILQLIGGILIIPFLFESVILGNTFLSLWISDLSWIWIIIGGNTLAIFASGLVSVLFTFLINLIMKNNIAPKVMSYILIPIIVAILLYRVFNFWDAMNFENGKHIYSFLVFLIMSFYSAIMVFYVIYSKSKE